MAAAADRAMTPMPGSGAPEWTTAAILGRHKGLALSVTGVVLVMVITLVAALLSSSAGAVSDRTACSAWSTANQDQRRAYAQLYVREHGAAPGAVTAPAGVEAAIDNGCMQAFASDDADQVTVVQAILHHL